MKLIQELKNFMSKLIKRPFTGEIQRERNGRFIEKPPRIKEGGLESQVKESNSLLYENFKSAENEQGKVQENLEDLQDGLESVASKLRNLGNHALQELVESLMKAQDDLSG